MMRIVQITATAAALAALLAASGNPAWAQRPQLGCTNGSGDVVAYPIVSNKGRSAISQGTRVYYSVKAGNAQPVYGSFVLQSALQPGAAASPPTFYPWNFTCTASTSPFIKLKLPAMRLQ